ncbi:MAG: hypothetical protein GY866_40310, partial [Proteobacteria bacterium]|nr:hypothetical protein [Pseudomonadota bacterium]
WNTKDLSGKVLLIEGIREYNGRKPSEGCPEWNEDPDGEWVILSLPALMDEEAYEWKHPEDPREIGEALWPERYPVSHLQQFMRVKHVWNSEWQQRPKPKGGNVINREWFKIVRDFKRGGKLIRFWDFASTPKEERKKNDPDFTAGSLLTYVEGKIIIIDIVATRKSPKDRHDLVKQTAVMDDEMYGSVMQMWEEEGGASGKDTTAFYLELLSGHLRAPFRVGKNKNFYIDLLANKAETGDVYCVKGPWLIAKCDGNTYFDESEAYPSSASHDDRLDGSAKCAFILVSGVQEHGDMPEEKEMPKAQFDKTLNDDQEFQRFEKTILKNKRIDESKISQQDYVTVIQPLLQQIGEKYISENDDRTVELVYDEIDRLDEIFQETETELKPHYFDQNESDPKDIVLEMAKGQGYVPNGCLLGGRIVMGLIEKGKDPCKGCNSDRNKCSGRSIE